MYIIKHEEESLLPDNWLINAIDIVPCRDEDEEHCVVIPRPGMTELLIALKKYASPMIYSTESDAFIEEVMVAFSIDQGDPVDTVAFEKSRAYMDLYTWSQLQCVNTNDGYKKSLVTLAECSKNKINDVWIVDDKPTLVDLPAHVLAVPSFFGDPEDRALFKLIDKLFIY